VRVLERVRAHSTGGHMMTSLESAIAVYNQAPDDATAYAIIDKIANVQVWDEAIRAGWMPLPNGRKRVIE
jgi:hypothetical protein